MKELDLKHVLLPLILGAFFYYLISPDVWFVRVIDYVIGNSFHLNSFHLNSFHLENPEGTLGLLYPFLRNYLMDMLWGYSLVFTLYSVLDFEPEKLRFTFWLAFFFSIGMESLQLIPKVPGTFDLWDIVAEGLAEGIAVLIIHYKLQRRK